MLVFHRKHRIDDEDDDDALVQVRRLGREVTSRVGDFLRVSAEEALHPTRQRGGSELVRTCAYVWRWQSEPKAIMSVLFLKPPPPRIATVHALIL